MFNSGILDVAMGLIIIYLLLSLVCTAINEMIEARLKIRAAELQRGLREMLQDPHGTDLVEKLYTHPLVFSLFQGQYNPAKTRNLPSYIPSRNFALALLDIVLPAEAPRFNATRDAMQNSIVATSNSLQPLREAIGKMANKEVKQALLTLLNASGNDIGEVRKNVQDWFDSSMDRVSGWYKRRVQWITLVLGLVVAVAVNADTIAIGTRLSHDVAMRDSLVAAAQEYAKDGSPQPTSQNTAQIEACMDAENSPECRIAKNLNEIRKLGLPIGWDKNDPTLFPVTPGGWLTKGLGLLLTAFAVTLGAPFWFDILNKFIVIRSTVRPKEKSPEEPPVNK